MLRAVEKGLTFFKDLLNYFQYGIRSGLFLSYVINFIRLFFLSLNCFRHALKETLLDYPHIDDPSIEKLKRTSKDLYSLLPHDPRLTYSFIIIFDRTDLCFFKRSLESIVNDVYPCEILLGFMHSIKQAEQEVIDAVKLAYPNLTISQFQNDHHIHRIEFINFLAQKADQNFMIFLDEDGWARPDLLFRYDQTLRILSHLENALLYCRQIEIRDNNYLDLSSALIQPTSPHFPFFLDQICEHGLLVSKSLWERIGGLRTDAKGAEWEDLILRARRQAGDIEHVPVPLYACRKGKSNDKSISSFANALEEYFRSEQLHWKVIPGYLPQNVRAVPLLSVGHTVQIIILYKDQKELTLKCVESLLKQSFRSFIITAVDNRSSDHAIAEEIQRMGGEVIHIDEPFNFSRLNNLAVERTETAKEADLILFLNNDVELDPDALEEMVRWIDQPHIGMVGCRLHYPDNRLQHGGVDLVNTPKAIMNLVHSEKYSHFEEMVMTKKLRFCDAVTAACALVKREHFTAVGGFDAIWYPIGYSDTNLAAKLNARGWKSFYTPYAFGKHHESVSRKTAIEDYEQSSWLHEHTLRSNVKR